MPWPYEEYTPLENFLLIFAFIIPIIIVYFVIRPLMFRYWDSRSESIDKDSDIHDDGYSND